jgi:hypothetical protein
VTLPADTRPDEDLEDHAGTAVGGSRTARGWAALDAGGMGPFWVATVGVLAVQLVGLAVYSAYLFHRFDLTDDFATYSQAWWLIGHGHLDPVNTIQSPSSPFWQSHFELAMWPLALIGRVWPHPVQLLWLQDVALVATEWIALVWVAALVRIRTGRARVVVGVAVLSFVVVNPWWYLTASFDIHFETLGLPFVLWSAYSLWKGRTRTSVIVALIGLTFGDVTALALVCVGVAGVVSRTVRRTAGWRVPLLVAGFSLAWVVLATALGANKSSGLVTNYGYLVGAAPRATTGWVTAHLFLHPGHALHVLGHRLPGIGRVVASAGLLGVATPWGLALSLGTLVPAALNVNQAFLTPTIAFQTVAVIPFVMVGTVMVLVRIGGSAPGSTVGAGDGRPHRARDGRPHRARDGRPATSAGSPPPRGRVALAVALAAGVVVLSLVQNLPLYGTLRTDWWRVDAPGATTLRSALPLVPADDEVVASQGIIGRFAQRTWVYPLLAAPQAFPVHTRRVVFVVAPAQGIEPLPAPLARSDVSALADAMHARVLARGHGVTVLEWNAPPGVRVIVLP